MKKIILVICGVALIALLSTLYVFNSGLNSKVSDENISFSEVNEETSSIHLSEIRISQDELINESDLIVRCKFSGNKNKVKVTAETSEGYATIYKMKSVEDLKGSSNKNFELGMFGDGDKKLEKGDEFLLFLCKNPNGVYRLVSYSQGFNKIRQKNTGSVNLSDSEDTSEIQSFETDEVMNLKELKNRIKELEK
ncbi:hypothetical protein CLHUN_22200 [Ruminiclostridium hungatei]|uniref:Uncharacterized protein n=1 Tax=Ruminiclostridium hungatei TaxID=48256 RepID=A0A1V4SL53_RUMHU|nr:hypothetical protein [Ruminiclostridium hungatei]OPX43977.1 hypothetical protein CLHUN_22200 [Ruminiclostridium hungatei]